MVETETRSLDLGEHEVGYYWEAGVTPPNDKVPGKWAVKKTPEAWAVIFISLSEFPVGPKYTIHTFPLTKGGERAAKVMAQKLVQIAWGYKVEPQF